MTSTQNLLSEYLQYDLYHSIGAYRVAREQLTDLERRLGADALGTAPDILGPKPIDHAKLIEVTQITQRFNTIMSERRHFAARDPKSDPVRALLQLPIPDKFPLTLDRRFWIESSPNVRDARRNPWGRPISWGWVLNFYDAAIAAIDLVDREDEIPERLDRELVRKFAHSMIWPRDRELPKDPIDEDERNRRRRRLRKARFLERVNRALAQLPGIPRETPHRSADATEFLHRIATDNLSSGQEAVPWFVVHALADAHLTQHAVQAWQSMSLGDHARHAAPHLKPNGPWPRAERSPTADEPDDWEAHWLHGELDRCIVLNTFVYCASRCAPWMFAGDDAECAEVFDEVGRAWVNVVPTRCMWISTQLSLLALHRRAYAYALKGERAAAYKDYYKLQRQIRNARRRFDRAPLHVAGHTAFLTCLEARANQNIGELYRAEHAQQPALKHFDTALECLATVDGRPEMRAVMTNSRWRIELLISRGKSSYEMGRHKDALRSHLEAWSALLELLAAESGTESNREPVQNVIAWLREVRFEPEIRKLETKRRLSEVVKQLNRIQIDERLGSLAADVLLRIGHVLMVLNLQSQGEAVEEMHAVRFIEKAIECDPRNTLAGADLLKAQIRFADRTGLTPFQQPSRLAKIFEHRPGGSDNFERITRIVEYLILLSMHPDTGPEGDVETRRIARKLLVDVFVHTDSISVRTAQAHRFLMKPRTPTCLPRDDAELNRWIHRQLEQGTARTGGEGLQPAIEFVCMRRYSSAYPLLPRPSTFRARGGGYFVRLHRAQRGTLPEGGALSNGGPSPDPSRRGDLGRNDSLGVVIDPGPDYVENLFRAGLALGDIDIIIVTHDHVDHLNSLDQLLSLFHYRQTLNPGKLDVPKKVKVYGTKSIMQRYDHENQDLKETADFCDLDGISSDSLIGGLEFKVHPLSSHLVKSRGHVDLANNPSYGVVFEHLESALSLAITGDVPAPPTESDEVGLWKESWERALVADVLVTHVGTLPLTELRQIAQVDARLSLRPPDIEELITDAASLVETVKRARDATKMALASTDPGRERDLLCTIRDLTRQIKKLAQRVETGARDLLPEDDSARPSLRERLVALAGWAEAVRVKNRELRDILPQLESRPILRDLLWRLVRETAEVCLPAEHSVSDAATLEEIRAQLEQHDPGLADRINFSMWLQSSVEGGCPADLVGLVPDVPDPKKAWQPPEEHPYLRGTLSWARAYRKRREQRAAGKATATGLLILGELSEELGTARGKIATRINDILWSEEEGSEPVTPDGGPAKRGTRKFTAVSSDVGLRVVVVAADDGDLATGKILCTTCDLDTDRTADESYHSGSSIREISVKGENEGIFYNCEHHDPGSQGRELFVEQIERFDVFGR